MAKMGNTALQIPLNQDLEGSQSPEHSVVPCAVTLTSGQPPQLGYIPSINIVPRMNLPCRLLNLSIFLLNNTGWSV